MDTLTVEKKRFKTLGNIVQFLGLPPEPFEDCVM